jgi:hypothetical protein
MIFWAGRPPTAAEAAEWYSAKRRWPVAQGTHVVDGECSCSTRDCKSPGAHPADEQWRYTSTMDSSVVRSWWGWRPEASVVLPTGVLFDVLDVPHAPGAEALRRLEDMRYEVGPAAETGDDRILIWVIAGARMLASLTEPREWPYDHLDLHCYSTGGFVIAPPCCDVRWLNPPDLGWVLPRADDIVGVIARACQEALSGPTRSG